MSNTVTTILESFRRTSINEVQIPLVLVKMLAKFVGKLDYDDIYTVQFKSTTFTQLCIDTVHFICNTF